MRYGFFGSDEAITALHRTERCVITIIKDLRIPNSFMHKIINIITYGKVLENLDKSQ